MSVRLPLFAERYDYELETVCTDIKGVLRTWYNWVAGSMGGLSHLFDCYAEPLLGFFLYSLLRFLLDYCQSGNTTYYHRDWY